MSELKFTVPGPDTPGYLKREKRRQEFFDEYGETVGPDRVDVLVRYLGDFLSADNGADLEEYLWDASENEINEILRAVGFLPDEPSGEEEEAEVDPKAADSSGDG